MTEVETTATRSLLVQAEEESEDYPLQSVSQSETQQEKEINPSQSILQTEALKSHLKPGLDLKGPFQQAVWTWVLAMVTFISVGSTVLVAWKSGDLESYLERRIFKESTTPLRVLRILAEINTILLTALISMSSRITMWGASSSERGISVPMWLAMSPSTSDFGLLKLLFWRQGKGRAKSPQWHRIWIIVRYAAFF